MPEIVALPNRGREKTVSFTADQLDEIHADLQQLKHGQAIVISKVDADGKPFPKDSSARNYARVFANAYQDRFGTEVETDEDGVPRRLLSTHAIPAHTAQGKPTGKYIAAVSNNTRETPVRQNHADGPPRSDLLREVRAWRKEHPRDRSFRNYTNWDYDTLRKRVNDVTGYNDGVYVPPQAVPEDGTDTPENGTDAPENSNEEIGTDTQPENAENTENAAG